MNILYIERECWHVQTLYGALFLTHGVLLEKSQTPGLALNPRAVACSTAQLHLVAAVASRGA